MEKKPPPSTFAFLFKRLYTKAGSGGGGEGGGSGNVGTWRWKFKTSTGLRWRKRFNLHVWFVDVFLFKIVSVFEAIFLGSTLCCFFLCCGCQF